MAETVPMSILRLAARCNNIIESAVAAIGPDLCGSSILDLCADNLPHDLLSDIKHAITLTTVSPSALSARLQLQMARYRREVLCASNP